MNVQDKSNAIASEALMVGLRNSTVINYLVSVRKPDTISYPKLITEICHHIDVEKTSNLEASKLSQDILLSRGKRKMDSQVGPFKQDGGNNGKMNRNRGNEGHNGGNNNSRVDHNKLRYHSSVNIPYSRRQSQLSSKSRNTEESLTSHQA